MNTFIIISALMAFTAAETVIQKNHPDGAWELHLTSEGNAVPVPLYLQKSVPIDYQPKSYPILIQQAAQPKAYPILIQQVAQPKAYPILIQQNAVPTYYQHVAQQPQYIFQSDEIPASSTTKFIPIISQSEVHHPDGGFQLEYKSADGQSYSEQGSLKRNFENDGNVVVKSGQYAYTAPDGTPIALNWVADEYGFKATGAHLPQAPVPAVVSTSGFQLDGGVE